MPNLGPLLPEIFLLSAICIVLIIDAFLKDEQRELTYTLSQLSLLGTALCILSLWNPGTVTVTMHGHFVHDAMSDVLKLALMGVSAMVLLYSRDYIRSRDMFRGEFFLLALFGVLGMMIMISARSMLVLYLGLELLALSQYALVAFRRDDGRAAEAAMKYFVLGALASGMLLYGISMIYGATGHIEFHAIRAALVDVEKGNLVLVFGIAFLVVGLAFKLGAVPFHMWLPDVYEGAPTAVTLYLGAAPKIAAFAMSIRLLVDAVGPLHTDWQPMLVLLAIFSIGLGNLVALVQTNIKRMLAYSTISHVGFLLLGVLAGTQEGYASSMFYTITYAIMASAAFGILLMLSRADFDAERIEDLAGLNQYHPWLAFLMMLTMMSMAGIPFLAGFYAKLLVLKAIVDQGMVGLALFSVLMSVVGAFYYLRVVKTMYFDQREEAMPLTMALDSQVVISANGLLLLLFGLFPSLLLMFCLTAFGL